jgi:chromosome segregation ATPase
LKRFRNSRWWPWAIFALAVLVLVGGTAAALLIWQSRSSAEEEILDLNAAGKVAEDITENTYTLTEEWRSSTLPNNLEHLVIKVRGSLARLQGEMDRTAALSEQIQQIEDGGSEESAQSLDAALVSLAEAQSLLKQALEQTGTLLAGLGSFTTADSAYRQGREKLFAAVQAHNQVVEAGSKDLSTARLEAASASGSLQEAESLIQSSSIEGLNTEAALSAINGLKTTVDKFDQACQRAESDDVEGHNNLMQEVKTGISDAPSGLLDLLDFSTWLKSGMEPSLEPVFEKLDETRQFLI